jgi:hypothetical protein
VPIARAIEEEERPKVKERQIDARKVHGRGQKVVEKSPQTNGCAKSRDVAAKQSGLGSDHTYRQAAKVVDQGSRALVQAMDSGTVSINAAAKLAELPKGEQSKIVNP